MFALMAHASLLVQLVLLILAGISVISWGIILYKWLHLRAAAKQSRAMLEALQACGSAREVAPLVAAARTRSASPLAGLVTAAAPTTKRARSREEIHLLLARGQTRETERLESHLIFLATTGSTAPFIGLLGTVWGIMDAFRGIGATGSASLAVVSPAIAEALVTTAAGLAAAIPAVMAYNVFVSQVRRLSTMTGEFADAVQHLLTPEPA